jgi:Peptidase C13 family
MISNLLHRLAAGLFGLLLAVVASSSAAAQDGPNVAVVAFGLFGDQSVFESEANGAARIVAKNFAGDPVIVRANSKNRNDATVRTLAVSLRSAAETLNADRDVLFLILTSHGSPDGLAIKAGNRIETLSPSTLARLLHAARIRHRVVIISACYSGIFIRHLANAETLVITAADADHPSFGCEDRAKWTYFGDAFFNIALRHKANLRDAFALARTLVSKRERQNGFPGSNPQIAGGETTEPLLQRGSAAPKSPALEPGARITQPLTPPAHTESSR